MLPIKIDKVELGPKQSKRQMQSKFIKIIMQLKTEEGLGTPH